MRRTLIVLTALAAGLAGGWLVSSTAPEAAATLEPAARLVGRLWVNAMQMTVIPLVVSLVITGVAALAGQERFGRTGARTLLLFVIMLGCAAAFGAVAASIVVPWIPVEGSAALRGAASEQGAERPLPDPVGWIVPSNVAQAAAEGAVLPLIVFSLAFGLAISRIAADRRATVLSFFNGVADAMLMLLTWVLLAAPPGVFALGFSLASRMGGSVVTALGAYVALLCSVLVICMLAMYPLAVFAGQVPLRRFAAAMVPAQAIAFSTRASLTALPALVQAAERRLRLPAAAVGVVLPLAVSTLRMSTAAGQVVSVIFAARLFGVELSLTTVALITVMAALLSFGVPGSPNAGFLTVAAVLLKTAGVPVEAAAILLAVDTIPDMFKTALNVTAHMSATTVVARWLDTDAAELSACAAAGAD